MVLTRLVTALVFCTLAVATTNASAEGFLGDRHLKALGGKCSVCHVEQPAAQKPPESKCTQCHGDRKKLGEKPRPKGTVNPHMNHVDELYCADCHHMHKKSTNYCEECHDSAFLGMKVP